VAALGTSLEVPKSTYSLKVSVACPLQVCGWGAQTGIESSRETPHEKFLNFSDRAVPGRGEKGLNRSHLLILAREIIVSHRVCRL